MILARSGAASRLDVTGPELRAMLDEVGDYLARVLEELPAMPMSDRSGAAEVIADPLVRQPPADTGRPLAELIKIIDRASRPSFTTTSAGYLAFIAGGGLVSSAIADLIADVLNRYTGLVFPAPGLVALEADVLRWLCDLFDLPGGSGGILTTGGSLATLSAIVTARDQLGEDFRDGTVYVTDQAHHATASAAKIAGFPARAIRVVPTDADLRMDVTQLGALVAEDRSAGRRPCCVVATAGTTNTGTIDPLPEIAALAAEEHLWFHVDAAYGGAFQLTDRGRHRMRGIELADSIVLDPHKSLFLPFGTGCLLVRDAAALQTAHAGSPASYLQDVSAMKHELPDFSSMSPELTREFRGLRLWLPLHLHGVAAFRTALDDKLDLTVHAYERLVQDPHLVVLAPPELSTIAFHVRLAGESIEAENAATAEVLRHVNAEQRVFLSTTVVAGRYLVRICILNFRTDRPRVEEAIESIKRHAAAVVVG